MRIQGTVRVKVMESDGEVWRVSVRIQNTSPYASPASGHRSEHCSEHCSERREAVLLQTFASTHAILRTKEGRFISLIDPPEGLRAAAASCTNTGLWPVLAGDEERQDTLLASPIILYDYPQIAPESLGDLFDGTEIDEILTLRILTLTDAEKDEVRRADGRAKEMLERTEQLGAEHLMKLHGVLREPKSARKETA
jgi:hydrogenase maturation protease